MSGSAEDVSLKYDFASKGSLAGMLEFAFRKLLMNTDDMLPATIVTYNRTGNVAVVQPAIHMLTNDKQLVERASIAMVPVLAIGGGNCFLNFPLVAGSKGWIKASDRDISVYMQNQTASGPNTNRVHSFEDGLFIPDVMSGMVINEEDENCTVLSTIDGTMRISLGDGRIKVTTPALVFDTPSVEFLNSSGEVSASFNGNFAFTGSVFTHNGKNVGSTHEHINGGGTGNSGPPA